MRSLGATRSAELGSRCSFSPAVCWPGIGDSYSPFEWPGYVPFDPSRRKPAPPRRVARPVAAEVIAPYAGKYTREDGRVRFIKTEGSHLYISDDGSSWDEVYAESDNVFFFKGRDITLTFMKDDTTGRVTRMDITRDGTTRIPAHRIE